MHIIEKNWLISKWVRKYMFWNKIFAYCKKYSSKLLIKANIIFKHGKLQHVSYINIYSSIISNTHEHTHTQREKERESKEPCTYSLSDLECHPALTVPPSSNGQ